MENYKSESKAHKEYIRKLVMCGCQKNGFWKSYKNLTGDFAFAGTMLPDAWKHNSETNEFEWHEVVYKNDLSREKIDFLYQLKDFLDGIQGIDGRWFGIRFFRHDVTWNHSSEFDPYEMVYNG